jgi:putative membrane protein
MQNGTNFLVRLFLTALAVMLTSYILPGVHVENFLSALILSLLLALLNVTLKPLLVIITIPVTVFTLGLFLLIINALIILLADWIMPGFIVDGFWWALLFSLVLSLLTSILRSLAR